MKHILEADGIYLVFNNRIILSDIYLKCTTGEITGLLGRNGTGKSSLMKIIYGTLNPENKSVRIDGTHSPKALEQPDKITFLPQFHFFPKHLKIKKLFQNFDCNWQDFKELFPEFKPDENKRTEKLSGGEKRLLETYLIIQSNSLFSLLDEPFTYLMPLHIEKIKALILQKKEQKGFLISDHSYQNVIEISDDVYALKNGVLRLSKDLSSKESIYG